MPPKKKPDPELAARIASLEEEIVALKAAYVGASIEDLRLPVAPYAAVVFRTGGRLLALPLWSVTAVSWAVELTPSAGTGDIAGIVNYHGTIVPVLDAAAIVNAPRRDVNFHDQMIYVRAAGKTVALLVDAVIEVEMLTAQAAAPGDAGLPRRDFLGAFETDQGILPILDPTALTRAAASAEDAGTSKK